MKAFMRKTGEIALSLLLVSLICLPVPAMSAFAEDVDGEAQEQSELTPEELLKLKQLKEAQEKGTEAPQTEADSDATVPTDGEEENATPEADQIADSENAPEADDVTADEPTPEADEDTVAEPTIPVAEEPADAPSPTTEKAAAAPAPVADQPAAAPAPDTAQLAADDSTVSTADELEAAFAAASASPITLADDITLSKSLTVAGGKTIMLEGNGHTITLEGATTLTVNGTLILNGPLTIAAASSHSGSMVTVSGGTLNMNTGVTLEGNGIVSAATGGGVSLTNKATFNMNGGTIENCGASQGGGVCVSSSTFNMSGDATIQNCRAYSGGTKNGGDGGGVFMEISGRSGTAQMTMSGNATLRNNSASSTGGGIQLETRCTLTMEGNASIVDNTADAAGGVMNYGMATLTTVYNNTSHSGAADIFNMTNARMKLSPVNPDWVLKSTGTHVTGWYIDNYNTTDDDGNQADGGHRWKPDDEASVEYVPTAGFVTEALHLIAGAPSAHVKVIWENEDGTVLYQKEVKADEVPAADEYTELSGNDEPTEPDTANGEAHEFTGWTETHPSEDEVVYIANYKLVKTHAADAHTLTIHYVDEQGKHVAPDYVETVDTGDDYAIHSPHVDGYEPEADDVTGTVGDSDVEKTVVYHAEKANVPDKPQNPGTEEVTDPTTEGTTPENPTSPAVVDPVPDSTDPQQAGTYNGNATDDTSAAGASIQQTGDANGRALAGLAVLAGISVLALGVAAARKRQQ